MISLFTLYQKLGDFIFPFDYYEQLAILRIGLAVWTGLQALELIHLGPRLYSAEGLAGEITKWSVNQGRGFNIFRYLGLSRFVIQMVFTVQVVMCIFLAFGLFSHAALLLVFLISVSRVHCSWTFIHGGLTVPTTLFSLMLLSPCNLQFSLDSYFGFTSFSHHPFVAANWAFRLMQIQLCLMYFQTFLWKSHVPEWIDGKAAFASTITSWWRREPSAVPGLQFTGIARLTNFYTMAVEALAPFFLWIQETRWIALLSLFILHIGIALSFNLWYFTSVSFTFLVVFVPAGALHAIYEILGVQPTTNEIANSLPSPYREIAVFCFVAVTAKMLIFGGRETPILAYLRKKYTLGNYFSLFVNQWEMFAIRPILNHATRYYARIKQGSKTEIWSPQHFLEIRFCYCLYDSAVRLCLLCYLTLKYPNAEIQIVREGWTIPPLRPGFFSKNENDLRKLKYSNSIIERHAPE